MVPYAAIPCLAAAALALLAGCIAVPELDATLEGQTAGGAYPELVPIAPLLAEGSDPVAASEALERDLTARTARLRARAAALRATEVIDPAARERLDEDVGR